MGQAKLVKKEWLKQGTVVIDVEMNRDKNGKLCGDVELNDVMEKVSYITPVSKGDGFVTRAMLLENIMQAYSGKMNKVVIVGIYVLIPTNYCYVKLFVWRSDN